MKYFWRILLRQVRGDAGGVFPLARVLQGRVVHIRGKDLDIPSFSVQRFQERHCDGVGFFPGRARGGPDAKRNVGVFLRQLSHDILVQGLPGHAVPEKRGDSDHKIIGERLGLAVLAGDQGQIVLDRRDAEKVHPPPDPAGHDAFLVVYEPVPGLLLDQAVKGLIFLRRQGRVVVGGCFVGLLKFQNLGSNALGREHAIDLSGVDGGEGHAGEFGCFRFLDEYAPARGPYGVDAPGAVSARAREDHGCGAFSRRLGNGLEKFIDGIMRVPFRAGRHVEGPVLDPDLASRWTEVEPSGKDPLVIDELGDLEIGPPARQQIGEYALVLRREVLDEDKREAKTPGQRRKEGFKGLEASGGSADPHDGEGLFGIFRFGHESSLP